MTNRLPILALVASSMFGCGTASTSRDHWAYVGDDPTLRSPPTMLPSRVHAINEEMRGQPPEVVQRRLAGDFVNWQQRVVTTIHDARDTCVRATGDSGERHSWSGYDEAFLACMGARGWTRPTGSDPL